MIEEYRYGTIRTGRAAALKASAIYLILDDLLILSCFPEPCEEPLSYEPSVKSHGIPYRELLPTQRQVPSPPRLTR